MKVYKINLDKDYNDYYAIANSFNEAEEKIVTQKKEEKEKEKTSIFTKDGSLRPEVTGITEDEPVVVKKIEMLTGNIVL